MTVNPVLSHFLMPNKRMVIFALKGVISMSLALFIAMHLELDRPFWAVVASMLLQARPEGGLVIEKGLYLVAGSLFGAVVAVLILGNFSEYPEIAVALLTTWLGIASFLSARVQHVNYHYFYGLTAVTAVLIVLLVMSDASTVGSLQIFNVAKARLSEAMVGAFCAAFISVLFLPLRLRDLLHVHAEKVVKGLLATVHSELSGDPSNNQHYKSAGAMLAAISQLNHDARASSFDGPQGAGRACACYFISNESMLIGSTVQALGYEINSVRPEISGQLLACVDEVRQIYGTLGKVQSYRERTVELNRLRKTLVHYKLSKTASHPAEVMVFKMLCNIVSRTVRVLDMADSIKHQRIIRLKARRIPPYQDALVSGLMALRTMLVFAACSWLWIGSGSPPAVVMMMVLPPFFSIAFAHSPVPEAVVSKLAIGAFISIPVSAVVALSLLSAGSGSFEILLLVMGAPLYIGLMAVSWPPTAPYGIGFCLPFSIITQPGNSMAFSADATVTTGLALICGLGILYAVFSTLRTPDNRLTHRRLQCSFRKEMLNHLSKSKSQSDLLYKTGGMIIKLFTAKHSQAHFAGIRALKNITLMYKISSLIKDEQENIQCLWKKWQEKYLDLTSGEKKDTSEYLLVRSEVVNYLLSKNGAAKKTDVNQKIYEMNFCLKYADKIIGGLLYLK